MRREIINRKGRHVGAVPEELSKTFGREILYEQSLASLHKLTKEEWKLRMEGKLFASRGKLHVTSYEELRAFIEEQLQGVEIWEKMNHE